MRERQCACATMGGGVAPGLGQYPHRKMDQFKELLANTVDVDQEHTH